MLTLITREIFHNIDFISQIFMSLIGGWTRTKTTTYIVNLKIHVTSKKHVMWSLQQKNYLVIKVSTIE